MPDRKPSKLGVAWTAGRLAGRRLLGRRAGERDLELGELLTGQLDQMKGLAMKVGQIVSYLDVPLPEPVQEQLARLQTGQRGMPAERVREVIEAALGRPVEAAFEAFDWEQHLHRPLLAPRFTFSMDYVREGYARNGPASPNARSIAMPPAYIWVARLQWGLWSILARLRARVSLRGMTDELLALPIGPAHAEARA